jgi:hypothetical protein
MQHGWVASPQVPPHEPPVAAHAVCVDGQTAPAATQEKPLQQPGVAPEVQPFCGQHGVPGVPHAERVPARHTWVPFAGAVPLATHAPRLQQPPARQEGPEQHGCPSRPHATQAKAAVHTWLVPQLVPAPTQVALVPSQHALVHEAPAQQVWPRAPHGWQTPVASQPRPAPLHVPPAQHGWPLAPHATHVRVASHTVDTSVQVPPPQHGWPVAPQGTQVPALHAPTVQRPPPQHAWVSAPQGTQVPPAPHAVPAPHEPPAQHGWLAPPHGTQPAALHTLPPPQLPPTATQRLAALQHPLPQLAPGQHA